MEFFKLDWGELAKCSLVVILRFNPGDNVEGCNPSPVLAVFHRAVNLEAVLVRYRGPDTIKGNYVQTIGVGITTFAEVEGNSTDELGTQ